MDDSKHLSVLGTTLGAPFGTHVHHASVDRAFLISETIKRTLSESLSRAIE